MVIYFVIMKYELIDHTADFGIRVFSADVQTLFADAAGALSDVITEPDRLEGINDVAVCVTGEDWPDLMVNWLREVLYLWTGKQQLVKTVTMLSLSEYGLRATLKTDPYDPDRHIIKHEIKAVTYHQIQVYGDAEGWEAEIIFDV